MEQSIEKIISTIDDAIAKFQNSVPGIQKLIYEELQPLLKQIKIKDGKLLNNLENLKLIGTVKNKLQKIIISAEYKKSVESFVDSFSDVSNLNNEYFKIFNNQFKPKKTLPIIKQLAIESTINDLLGQGMSSNVIDPIQQILNQNITSGGNYAGFQELLRDHILNNETGEGSLVRYTKQITTDAIHQYNAQYHDAIAQDLQFNWGRYVGSNIRTSREFCIFLTKKQWVNKTELTEITRGHIDNHVCKLSKTTGLPLGMIPGTNETNFKILRGGYNCGHQFFWVPDNAVPEDVKNNIAKPVETPEKIPIPKTVDMDALMIESESFGNLISQTGPLNVIQKRFPDLSHEEILSIQMYGNTTYRNMNKYKRDPESVAKPEYYENFGKLLNNALDKLPDYKAQVYRGADIDRVTMEKYEAAFKAGKPIVEDGFLSTSREVKYSFTDKNTNYIIKSKTGKNVENIIEEEGSEEFAKEKEVLFKSGSQFKITDIKTKKVDGVNKTIIWMEEL